MKTFKVEGTPRTDLGKKASKKLRSEGLIPAIIYGQEPVSLPYSGKLNPGEKLVETGDNKGIIVTDFTVTYDGIRKLIYTPDIHLVEIDLKGDRVIKAVLKEIQFHPVSENILHLDFLEVFDNKPIVMNVPVFLTGHAAGVKAGGKLNHAMRRLKVKGQAEMIPEKLEINVDKLELGHVIKVGELKFDKVEVVNPKNAVVCSVTMTRAAQTADAAAAAAAPAEGAAAPADSAAAPASADKKEDKKEDKK